MADRPRNSYSIVLNAFTEDEIEGIVQIKRFFECYEGDPEFRESVNAGSFTQEQKKYLRKIGIHFDLQEVALLWENPDIIHDYVCHTYSKNPSDLSEQNIERIKKYPLLELWFRFIQRKHDQYKDICAQKFPIPNNQQFDTWRRRRIVAAESELGAYNHNIDHPTWGLELCDGCSVQCWFCSFSAKKLQGVLDYDQNRNFFREIVQTGTDLFGANAAGMALLYYATEPYDNPHYIDYMRDFAQITVSPVCTSTAVCSDSKWIKDLIAYYRSVTLPWPRLSVLSTKILHKIHEQHTPMELRDVSMIMQMRDSVRPKVSGGRILDSKGDMRQRDNTNYMQDIIPQGSIACVTGFYVNLYRKDIKLVSPCYTSSTWPLGYRVFDQASFETADDFRTTILDMIDRSMPAAPPAHMPFRLRDDLVCRPLDNGFDLVSPNQIHHFQNKQVFQAIGQILAGPLMSFEEASDQLVNRYGQNPFEVHAALNNMFQGGFLDEVQLPESCIPEHA